MKTIASLISPLEYKYEELSQLAGLAAVHHKKFEFAVSQLKRFLTTLREDHISISHETPLTSAQIEAVKQLNMKLDELEGLLGDHQVHCWAHFTLDTPSQTVPSTLTQISSALRSITTILDPKAAQCFDDSSPEWLQYHLLDLQAIKTSFEDYIYSGHCDEVVKERITARLTSLNSFLEQYSNESISQGIRVFSPISVNYQSWRLNHSDFEEIKEIGCGVSSHVYYGHDKRSNTDVAIKKLNCEKLTGPQLLVFQREISVLATATHPTLLKFIGATDTVPLCIVTSWMPNGNLYEELHTYKRLSPTMRTIAAFDIARGMQYLHSLHIIHRDLKSLNILLDAKGFIRICDFGYSRHEGDQSIFMTKSVGTSYWMAPELFEPTSTYSNKIDVYAYGIILWEIVSGQAPYGGMDPLQVATEVLYEERRPEIPPNTPQPLADLMKRCWDQSPDLRPTFAEIVQEFTTGNVLMAEADREQFLKYVKEKTGGEIDLCKRIEQQLSEPNLTLQDVIETIEKNGIPDTLVQRCWSFVEKAKAPNTVVGKACSLFLSTPVRTKAVKYLRSLPPDSVPFALIAKAVEGLPSGSEEFDNDLVMAACKNGGADACVVYALAPQQIKLALTVVARQGVELGLKAAVADRCVQSLKSDDPSMVCAAIKCLIEIGEVRRLTLNVVKKYLRAEEEGLRNVVCVATAQFFNEGQTLPFEDIEWALEVMDENPFAEILVINACKSKDIVMEIVDKVIQLKQVKSFEVDQLLKIAAVAARHKNMKDDVMNLLNLISTNDEKLLEAKQCIINYLSV